QAVNCLHCVAPTHPQGRNAESRAMNPPTDRPPMPLGPLLILSGPSGSGKSTVIRGLLADPPGPLRLSVSATTRAPRAGERDGVEYHFWTRERFEDELAAGAFLEHASVHGNYYGT